MASASPNLTPYAKVVQRGSLINEQGNPSLKILPEVATPRSPKIEKVSPPPDMPSSRLKSEFLPQLLGFPSNGNLKPSPPASVVDLATSLQGVNVYDLVALEVIRSAERQSRGLPPPQDNIRRYGFV